MKKTFQLFLLVFSVILLTACDNSIQRADRAIGLIQENVTKVVNELNEIQVLENNLQRDFESMLDNPDDLSVFNLNDSQVQVNIQNRQTRLTIITETATKLSELAQELEQVKSSEAIPSDQFNQAITLINNLTTDLTVYVEHYQANLNEESMTFKSIANPETDYNTFFGVFDNINALAAENNINLDKLLVHFEPLNSLLVNLKVFLVDAQQ